MPNLRATKLYTAEQIRNSPSRGDGVSEALEHDYRRKTCLFIKAAGKELELPVDAVATALVFFHKFYMLHSFHRHERLFVGSACLFLAAKVEESSKRVEVVMSTCWKVWHGGRDPPAENEKAFKRLREKILIGERCVLHTLGFQLTVEHPYSRVITLLKKIVGLRRDTEGGEGGDNKTLSRQLYQAATSFVNDSLLTTVCIQYRPGQVAAAVVYLSYLYMGLPRVDTALLEADGTVVAGICDTILSLYDEQGAGHAAVVVSDIRDMLKQRMTNNAPNAAGASAAGTSSPAPPPPPAPSLRPTPSPRPTPPPSPRTTADPASSSSSSPPPPPPPLRRMAANVGTDNVSSSSISNGAAVAAAGDGGFARRKTARPVEDARRHHHHHRDPRNSPSRGGGGGGGDMGNCSVKRKSGESGSGLKARRRERGQGSGSGGGGGGGAAEPKRHKASSLA